MQTCPEWNVQTLIALASAPSKSQSAKMMLGDLPPSSSTVRFMREGAAGFTRRQALLDRRGCQLGGAEEAGGDGAHLLRLGDAAHRARLGDRQLDEAVDLGLEALGRDPEKPRALGAAHRPPRTVLE